MLLFLVQNIGKLWSYTYDKCDVVMLHGLELIVNSCCLLSCGSVVRDPHSVRACAALTATCWSPADPLWDWIALRRLWKLVRKLIPGPMAPGWHWSIALCCDRKRWLMSHRKYVSCQWRCLRDHWQRHLQRKTHSAYSLKQELLLSQGHNPARGRLSVVSWE